MTTYYVDFVNGLDANNGLGPDASAVSNKPWKTLTKALGAAGIASGDTVYLAPGSFRETVSVVMTAATVETFVVGDPGNARGFKTSGGALVAPGPVILTGYTTNDKTASSATILLTLGAKNHLTFQNILFQGGNATIVSSSSAVFTKFTDCAFAIGHTGGGQMGAVSTTFGVALNWTFDRCDFLIGSVQAWTFTLPSGSGADYDALVLFSNCRILGAGSTSGFAKVAGSGASAQLGGGVRMRNCTYIGGGAIMATTTSTISTSIPCVVDNCFCVTGGAPIVANALGHITEDYNLLVGAASTNVTAGTHSKHDGSYAPLVHFGQERIWGMFLRPFGEPMAGSPLLGFGNDGSQTAYDVLNRPRPAGGAASTPAAGALERGNTFGKETTTTHTGSNAISITGPGYQDFFVPVDATSTTISVYTRRDATYAGTNPQVQLLINGEIAVAAQAVTDAGSASAWNQVSLAAFTPSAKGIVTLRLVSGDTNGGGRCFFDTVAIS